MIGRKRSRQAARLCVERVNPRRRSASSAEIDIRMAFFFTMPISRIGRRSAHDAEICLERHQRSRRERRLKAAWTGSSADET